MNNCIVLKMLRAALVTSLFNKFEYTDRRIMREKERTRPAYITSNLLNKCLKNTDSNYNLQKKIAHPHTVLNTIK